MTTFQVSINKSSDTLIPVWMIMTGMTKQFSNMPRAIFRDIQSREQIQWELLSKHLTQGWDLGRRMRLQACQACRKLGHKRKSETIRWEDKQVIIVFFTLVLTQTHSMHSLWCAAVVSELHLVFQEINAQCTVWHNKKESLPVHIGM